MHEPRRCCFGGQPGLQADRTFAGKRDGGARATVRRTGVEACFRPIGCVPVRRWRRGEAGWRAITDCDAVLDALAAEYLAVKDWEIAGRDHQRPPPGRLAHLAAARRSRLRQDAGRRRMGAWAGASAGDRSDLRIALVAETLGDAREVMIDGVSGICRIARRSGRISRSRAAGWSGRTARWRRSSPPKIRKACAGRRFISPGATSWPNGSMPRRPSTCCSSAFASGADPRQLVTTTPRPVPLLKALMADPGTAADAYVDDSPMPATCRRASSRRWTRRYGGTRLGRQELDGELIEDREDALWKRGDDRGAGCANVDRRRSGASSWRSIRRPAPGQLLLRHRRRRA